MPRRVAEIPVVEPFPWLALLDYFRFRLIPGVERLDGECFVRRLGSAEIAVRFDAHRARLVVTADGRVPSSAVAERVAQLFVADHDGTEAAAHLRRDPLLQRRIAAVPGMRPLGAWSPFELCVRTIVGQQVTVAAAGTLMRRLVERCGEVAPENVLAADLAHLGMPGRRAMTIRALAEAVLERRVQFDQPWSAIDTALASLPGFGPWTRGYLAIRLGRETDAFPASDLGLIRAAGVSSAAELSERAERWRPWRAYAATYLWAVQA